MVLVSSRGQKSVSQLNFNIDPRLPYLEHQLYSNKMFLLHIGALRLVIFITHVANWVPNSMFNNHRSYAETLLLIICSLGHGLCMHKYGTVEPCCYVFWGTVRGKHNTWKTITSTDMKHTSIEYRYIYNGLPWTHSRISGISGREGGGCIPLSWYLLNGSL